MSLKRLLKLLMSFLMGQGVGILTQLMVPPLFLLRYAHGVEVYGEWIALTAAISYLNTLNYGVQSYANNQMAIHYHRNELKEAKTVQASALRLLLIALVVLSLLGSVVFFLPISSILNLRHIGSREASLTVFLMLLQLLINWIFALISNSYLVIGEAHRGQVWMNAQRLVAMLAMSALLWYRSSFPELALAQVVSVALFLALVGIDVYKHAPILFPSLHYGNIRSIVSILKPSGYFGLLAVSSFLCWQGPLLILQKLMGPTSVAIFALTRIVFNMSRQMMIVLTFTISQDITLLVGQKNWEQLRRLYDLSEKVVLFVIPTVTVGTLLMCPALFSIWLHKRSLFDPGLCLLMASISGVMGIKEHKYQFQSSSNQHQSLSRFTIGAYCFMLLASALMLRPFGIKSLLYSWLLVEIVQTIYILHLNLKLFPKEVHISTLPVVRLFLVLMVALGLAAWPTFHNAEWSLFQVVAVAIGFAAMLACFSYFLFGLEEVRKVVGSRIRQKLAISR